MPHQFSINPAEVAAELNNPEVIATVITTGFNPDIARFKLKANDARGIALEIKDMLGRSEYNAIDIYDIVVTKERAATEGEVWFDGFGHVNKYAPGEMAKGWTDLRAILRQQP